MPKAKDGAVPQEIIARAQEHVEILVTRQWEEIAPILEEEEEITLALQVKVTRRATQPGEHADKSNRIRTALSFSSRHTDSVEGELDDPQQPGLGLDDRPPAGEEPPPQKAEKPKRARRTAAAK